MTTFSFETEESQFFSWKAVSVSGQNTQWLLKSSLLFFCNMWILKSFFWRLMRSVIFLNSHLFFSQNFLLPFFPKSNSFGVFSHSKGFGAELLSDSLWFSGADPSWAAKSFRGRFHQGSAKAPPRFHQGFTKVAQVSWSLWSSGADPFWGAKRFCGRFPHHFFQLVAQFLNFFFPNSVSFGAFSHSKGLGEKWHVCLLGLFAANGFRLPKGSLECSPNSFLHRSHRLQRFFGQLALASEKVLWRVPPTILCICLPNGCCFIKVLWRVPPTVLCRCCWGILWAYFLQEYS